MKNAPGVVELNESDSALDAFCLSRGTSIVFLDEKLASLPDDNPNKGELQRIRNRMEDAHRAGQLDLLDGWFHAYSIGLKSAVLLCPLATFGQPFKKHSSLKRKPGPIRKAIARELKKNPALKNREIFSSLAATPPKGWTFFDNRAGRYIEGPTKHDDMGYPRFSEICLEERNKLKT
jgi:hypothetical protein